MTCLRFCKHGMNLQIIAGPSGEILWVSGALPGAVHDLTAARIWGIAGELAAAGLVTLADKGYIGAGEPVLTPYRGRNKPASHQASGQRPAQMLAYPAQAALLPWRAGQLAKAIHVLQTREIGG
jgi:hypothetical protein